MNPDVLLMSISNPSRSTMKMTLRSLNALIAFLVLASACLGQETNVTEVDSEIVAAKEKFNAQIALERNELIKQLHAKLEFAKRRGILELVESVEKEIEDFESNGKLPTVVSVSRFESSVARAVNKLELAYKRSIKKYVQDGLTDDARFLREEFVAIKKDPLNRPSFSDAVLEISSGANPLQPFANRKRAFTNRSYVWGDVPPGFKLKKFAQGKGGSQEPVNIEVKSAGIVYIAMSSEDKENVASFLQQHGWEPTEHRFSYNARGKTVMYVYRKLLAAGKYKIPRVNFSGPTILSP